MTKNSLPPLKSMSSHHPLPYSIIITWVFDQKDPGVFLF